ncbi:LEAF RUST 10 DISEASE-RESISTANCE LOCUS RECEPTOR-LIKE PROTEIN KINASE-like 2.1 isoform X2 [Vicia villosa]|uniref:LEAF RUST 10 DISEASE-RESISTANCE LOCUS RECEPTOR-LIKE PROTEIN KINASE-like 2.1 isoform X2 n=1 Tax=Vicia villosa TaxID=3911 RepID=UPI00273B5A99|nr:LEAF RUST 10 DISEASE-RESISTANCE LOCUS RECEPTOR-LIKE PROTEIN KINASE-like 2.1 isoform X2 [Vicia villosa]
MKTWLILSTVLALKCISYLFMMALVYKFLIFLFSQLMLLGNGYQEDCPASFICGYLGNISFPFTTIQHQDCGLLPIHNCYDPKKPKMIQFLDKGKWFEVGIVNPLEFRGGNATSTCVFRDGNLYKQLHDKNCEAFKHNYTLPPTSHFVSFHMEFHTTLFMCNRSLRINPPKSMYKYTHCPLYDFYYQPYNSGDIASRSAFTACTKALLPAKDFADTDNPFTFVTADIYTQVNITEECANCHYNQNGRCQVDSKGRFYCANVMDAKQKGPQWIVKLGIAIGVAVLIIGVAVLMLLAYCLRTKIFTTTILLFKRKNSTNHIIEEFLKEHGPLPAARYNYSDIKKITNSFKNKLGQGGYGSVYKGKLHDERNVAVKILSESKGEGEDFINEVASISRTSHVNVVRLLGFCLDGSKKALIYEFMPNGSLEKFIYEDKNPVQDDHQLDCNTLYHIVVGVARGLEYLHRGCNTRILHFDIKPHNILLDDEFCPKISDFGLAKICPKKESIVSIIGARGTPGYIAPELFSRNFGGVSHKSDVYSYGMMVLEMVGRRKNIKVEVDCSSELYFPHWIYKRLELNQDLGLGCIKNEIDEEMVRKMTVVSLWCIQTNPLNRPSMHKVVEMLEGNLQVLDIPPKPFLSSPSTSPTHLSSEIL